MAMKTETASSTDQLDSDQYLTFILKGEEYAIDILKVQEIRNWEPVTNIPNTPDYVLGAVNLRGTVVPVIDLRRRFELEEAEFGETTIVIIVKIEHDGKHRTVGFVADAVSEVYRVARQEIRTAPDLGASIALEYIFGLATVDEKMLILIEIDSLVNSCILQNVADREHISVTRSGKK